MADDNDIVSVFRFVFDDAGAARVHAGLESLRTDATVSASANDALANQYQAAAARVVASINQIRDAAAGAQKVANTPFTFNPDNNRFSNPATGRFVSQESVINASADVARTESLRAQSLAATDAADKAYAYAQALAAERAAALDVAAAADVLQKQLQFAADRQIEITGLIASSIDLYFQEKEVLLSVAEATAVDAAAQRDLAAALNQTAAAEAAAAAERTKGTLAARLAKAEEVRAVGNIAEDPTSGVGLLRGSVLGTGAGAAATGFDALSQRNQLMLGALATRIIPGLPPEAYFLLRGLATTATGGGAAGAGAAGLAGAGAAAAGTGGVLGVLSSLAPALAVALPLIALFAIEIRAVGEASKAADEQLKGALKAQEEYYKGTQTLSSEDTRKRILDLTERTKGNQAALDETNAQILQRQQELRKVAEGTVVGSVEDKLQGVANIIALQHSIDELKGHATDLAGQIAETSTEAVRLGQGLALDAFALGDTVKGVKDYADALKQETATRRQLIDLIAQGGAAAVKERQQSLEADRQNQIDTQINPTQNKRADYVSRTYGDPNTLLGLPATAEMPTFTNLKTLYEYLGRLDPVVDAYNTALTESEKQLSQTDQALGDFSAQTLAEVAAIDAAKKPMADLIALRALESQTVASLFSQQDVNKQNATALARQNAALIDEQSKAFQTGNPLIALATGFIIRKNVVELQNIETQKGLIAVALEVAAARELEIRALAAQQALLQKNADAMIAADKAVTDRPTALRQLETNSVAGLFGQQDSDAARQAELIQDQSRLEQIKNAAVLAGNMTAFQAAEAQSALNTAELGLLDTEQKLLPSALAVVAARELEIQALAAQEKALTKAATADILRIRQPTLDLEQTTKLESGTRSGLLDQQQRLPEQEAALIAENIRLKEYQNTVLLAGNMTAFQVAQAQFELNNGNLTQLEITKKLLPEALLVVSARENEILALKTQKDALEKGAQAALLLAKQPLIDVATTRQLNKSSSIDLTDLQQRNAEDVNNLLAANIRLKEMEATALVAGNAVGAKDFDTQVKLNEAEILRLNTENKLIPASLALVQAREAEIQSLSDQSNTIRENVSMTERLTQEAISATVEQTSSRLLQLQIERKAISDSIPDLQRLADEAKAKLGGNAPESIAAALAVSDAQRQVAKDEIEYANEVAVAVPAALQRAAADLKLALDQITTDTNLKVDEINRGRDQKISDIATKAADDAAKIASKAGLDRVHTEEDVARQLAQAGQNAAAQMILAIGSRSATALEQQHEALARAASDQVRQEEDLQRQLRQLREKAGLDETNAIGRRNAIGLWEARQAEALQEKQLKENASITEKRRKQDAQLQLLELAINAQREIAQANATADQQIKDAIAAGEREKQAKQDAYNKQIAQLNAYQTMTLGQWDGFLNTMLNGVKFLSTQSQAVLASAARAATIAAQNAPYLAQNQPTLSVARQQALTAQVVASGGTQATPVQQALAQYGTHSIVPAYTTGHPLAFTAHDLKAFGYAGGGDFPGNGRPVVVGDAGRPEIYFPRQAGSITTLDQLLNIVQTISEKTLSAQSNGGTRTLNVHMEGLHRESVEVTSREQAHAVFNGAMKEAFDL